MEESQWYLRTQDDTFGPETKAKLIEWAKLGRIQPGQEVSEDEMLWQRVEDVPFLDMRFSIDIGDGNPRGPFHRAAAEALLASGRLPPVSKIVETRAPFPPEEEPPHETPSVESAVEQQADTPVVTPVEAPVEAAQPVEKVVEKIVEKVVEVPVEKIVEVPVEKIVEKVIEVPVEKIVEVPVEKEVVKEVRIEVPVDRIVEKVVVDETRVHELEGLLEEERRHTADLHQKMDEASRAASEAARAAAEREAALKAEIQGHEAEEARLKAEIESREITITNLNSAAKDAAEREGKYVEQVRHLEDELRRLPQAASEVADIQAAMYALMSGEAEAIAKTIDEEKREFEAAKQRYLQRSEQLMEHRREILKRAGANVDDMTRKALVGRPEDPRMRQLRREMDELRRVYDRAMEDDEAKIRALDDQLRIARAENARRVAGEKDITQLRAETEQLREHLQRTEKELLNVKQLNEELTRQKETSQQTLMARLASLESPCIGNAATLETNQSREAKMVKLPGWMRLKH